MIRKYLQILVMLLLAIFAAGCSSEDQKPIASRPAPEATPVKPSAPVPAHFNHPPGKLGPTLAADEFTGKTRAAYRVAKEIPQTLAQLPCYCYCDQSVGHKSLHSCFEDEHAAHCVVCVDEALLAYSLQKEQKMTPEQVREKIIEKYSAAQ